MDCFVAALRRRHSPPAPCNLPHLRIRPAQRFAALRRQHQLPDRLPGLVQQHRMRLTARIEMRLAPLPQTHHDREQVVAPLRQRVFLIGAAVGRCDLLEHAQFDQRAQPRRQHALGDAEILLEVAEPAQAVERVAHDQQRPPVADRVQCARH
ncbi:hypothetical protein chiPu_0031767, partial [Chiloscyllium punctatum]|nr:hypothetical protein [Chiloscyllium punctatum]